MFADCCIDAALGQQQSFDRMPSHQMGGHNFIDIGFCDVPVPNSFRIYDHGWPVFALVQAAGLVDADALLQAGHINRLLEP
jgi:hypothetical protein